MRVPTGVGGLDKIIDGGFPEHTVTLVSGRPGTGKTLLGLSFLIEGCKRGERCCYITLTETKDEIIRACNSIESLKVVNKYLGKKLAVEYIPFNGTISINKFVKILSKYPKLDRLVIDSINKLLIFADSRIEYRTGLIKIVNLLKPMKSSLLLCETKDSRIDTGNGESFEVDGVINLSFLDIEEKPLRTLTIEKMRYTSFEPRVPYEFIIDRKGIRLGTSRII